MVTSIHNGVRISVEPKYHSDTSKPDLGRYIHSYEVIIENLTGLEIQLLKRHWIITDASGMVREVKGDGVIGQQPILGPEEIHIYNSWCPLPTPYGKMEGTYLMRRTVDDSTFFVDIPAFKLIADFTLN